MVRILYPSSCPFRIVGVLMQIQTKNLPNATHYFIIIIIIVVVIIIIISILIRPSDFYRFTI
jgi:hypothetical protein